MRKKYPCVSNLVFAVLALFQPAFSQVNVVANRYDNARTGANLGETTLTVQNVNVNQFGRLYSYTVDGAIYAQPLYVAGVTIAGASHNVVYAATMNDKVYAFDADVPGSSLWSRDFTDPTNGITAIPITDLVGSNALNIVGNVGIESTPVINLSTNTMYLVARTKENGAYFQRLHALDITTGADKTGSPVVISGSVSGSATDAINGTLTFDPKMHNQRAGLALTNGVVVIAWGSHEDVNPYHGWVMGYDASALTQVGIICTTPNGAEGGIWQSGRAPFIDSSGNAYFMTGNGDWDGTSNFGDSVLKLSVGTQGLSILDWFTPSNQSTLDAGDVDLGSSGPMLIPGTDVVLAGGKDSNLYLLHSGNLGQEVSGNTQVIQTVAVNGGMLKSGPAFWNAPEGPLVYLWAQSDFLKAYHFNGTSLDSTIFATGTIASPGSPGGALTVSANGNAAGTGIVWAELTTSGSANHGNAAGVLRAFNAENLQELWDSEQSPARDRLGTLVKFVPPVVVNGKVYAATYDNLLAVYGLLNGSITNPDFSLSASNLSATAGATASGTVTVSVLNGFSGTVNFSVSGLPSGATASFNPQTVTGAGSTALQIATGTATAPGTYTVTITGTSGTLSHTTTAQLNVTRAPAAPAISIDFVGLGTAMGSSEIAGVIGKANWNNATGASSSAPFALIDENGNASTATVTWRADNAWATKIADVAGNARMMKGYLDNSLGRPTTVSVSGLTPSASGYNVFIYADGDNTGTRTGAYQISGSGITTATILATDSAGTNFSGAFVQANNSAGNYVEFTIQATAFTITATPSSSSDGYSRAPLNGIQIVPASGPDFSLAASGISTVAGGSGNGTVNVSAVNGFSGTVSFSVSGLPSGATATFNPATVTGPGSTTLQIAAAASTPAGTYPLTITGSSGSTSHTAVAQLTVTGNSQQPATAISVDFVGSATTMASTEVAGVIGKANWNNATGASSSTPLALVDENGNPTSATVTWRADGIWQTKITDAPGSVRLMKGYLDTSHGGTTSVTVAGLTPSSAGYNVYVYLDGDNTGARTGSYQISGSGIPTTTILATDAAGTNFSGTFVQANNSAGNYVEFTIQATGFTLTATPSSSTDGYPRAPLNGIQIVPASSSPDFSLAATNVSEVAGGSGNGTVNVSAVNGFSGTVNFSVSGLPSGATASFNPTTVTGAGSATLQVATAATTLTGTYPLTITGSSGSLSHTTSVQLTVTSNSPQPATAISVDFVGLATAMASTEVAGVVGKANWNNATGAARSAPLALVDENGNPTSATLTWRADGVWQTKIADAPGSVRMMKGYLDTSHGGATTLTVAGLPATTKGYYVYLYTDGDNTGARTGSYQISGAGITTTAILATDAAGTNFSGTFVQANNSAGNYVQFTIQATGFTLSAKPSSSTDGYLRAAVNGLEIVPIP